MFNVGFSFWQVPRPTSGSSCCSSYRTGRPAPGTSNGPIGRRESSNWLIPKPSPNCGVFTKISLIWTTKQWGELWGNLYPQLKMLLRSISDIIFICTSTLHRSTVQSWCNSPLVHRTVIEFHSLWIWIREGYCEINMEAVCTLKTERLSG